MALNESRPARGLLATLNKVAESQRRTDEELFSRIGESAARALALHDTGSLSELTAVLKRIKDIPTARLPAESKDRFYAMYLTARRGVAEVESVHRRFNPVQEGMNVGNTELRASTCNRVIDVFHPAVEQMLTTGSVKGFNQLPELAARLMATSDQVNLQHASHYLTRLVQSSDNPKIVQQAQGVLDIVTPSLRRMTTAFSPVQTVCRAFERRQQKRRGINNGSE